MSGGSDPYLYDVFRPWKDRSVEVREYLQQLRVQEYARWSFGEHLPVREERLDDPALVSWAFANIAALLDYRLDRSGQISRGRHPYVGASAGTAGFAAPDGVMDKRIDVFISHSQQDQVAAAVLFDALTRKGVSVFMYRKSIQPGTNVGEALYRARESARVIVVLLSYEIGPLHAIELEHVVRLANEGATLVVPVFLGSESISIAPPELRNRIGFFYDEERSWEDIARRLIRQLRALKL